MNENIHFDKEPFIHAYNNYKDEPSANVWSRIGDELDKTEAQRRHLPYCKYATCIVFVLLLSKTLFDNGIIKAPFSALNYTTNYTPGTTKNRNETKHIVDENSINILPVFNEETNFKQRLVLKDKVNKSFFENPIAAPNDNLKDLAFRAISFKNKTDADTDVPNQVVIVASAATAGVSTINKITSLLKSNGQNVAIIDTNNVAKATYNNVSSAQTTQTKRTQNFTELKLTPYFSADISQYQLDDDNTVLAMDEKRDIEEHEKHELSYSAGVLLAWQMNKKLAIKTGLTYSNTSIGIQPQTLYASHDANQNIGYKFITSSGYAFVKPIFGTITNAGDSVSAGTSTHHLQFVSLPVMASVTIIKNKHFTLSPSAGVAANFLLSSRVKTEFENTVNDKEQVVISRLTGIRHLYTSFVADATMQFKVNQCVSLTLIPSFKYAINPITKSNNVDTYPYSFGVGAGITYRMFSGHKK